VLGMISIVVVSYMRRGKTARGTTYWSCLRSVNVTAQWGSLHANARTAGLIAIPGLCHVDCVLVRSGLSRQSGNTSVHGSDSDVSATSAKAPCNGSENGRSVS
jgi:hypothetical protein